MGVVREGRQGDEVVVVEALVTKAAEARKLIGKLVAWDDCLDYRRGTYCTRLGTIISVQGKNVEIGGDWKWLPNLVKLREATEEDKRLCR